MPEIVLHYIWQKELFRGYKQETTDGKKIEVLCVGKHNTDAGPDFTDVHLRLTDSAGRSIELIGNIEVHVHSSDWFKHRHHLDKAYDNVILHVVRDVDKVVYNSQGEPISQCALQYPTEQDYLSRLVADAHLMDSAYMTHRCAKVLLRDPSLLTNGWKQTMLTRRLTCKTHSIERLLGLTTNSWEEAFYISLAHYFGFHTNGIPFEQLAINTPLSYLRKHRDNLFQLTAILMGQSGLLEPDDEWCKEYEFLRTKFGLTPINPTMWKMGRMHPQNSPRTRIRQFAQLLHQSEFLFSKILDTNELESMRELFSVPGMGRDSIDILIINVAVPFKYAYGQKSEALDLLSSIPAENNRIIRQWRELGQVVTTSADSQALIHLYQTCCQNGQCLNCDVAYQIFIQFPE
ncbi:MAG: DUF2851 family protein [Paludibacteraceae bacterium]|nr:DUF2851 family protein [Paludibacteraceae bacterium]